MKKEAVQYLMTYYLRLTGIFTLGFLGFIGISFLLEFFFGDNISAIYSGAEVIFIIFSFALALAEYRKILRVILQVGISRKTTWLATLSAMVVSAGVMGLIWILFRYGLGFLNVQAIKIFDMYEILFGDIGAGRTWLLNMLSFIMVFYLGSCINLIYAHLEKYGVVAISVGVPVGINLLFTVDVVNGGRFVNQLVAAAKWFARSWNNALILYMVLLLLFMALSYILNRRLTVVKGEKV